MSSPLAYINPEMLIWSRKTVNLTDDLAAQKIGISIETLNDWEEGSSFPTIKQLYRVAHIYQRPFSLFYLPHPPKHFKALKDFRKFPDVNKTDPESEYLLQKEILLFQSKREIAISLYQELEIPVPNFNLSGKSTDTPQNLARSIIEHLEINHRKIADIKPGFEALNYWKTKLEKKGILVFQAEGIPLTIMRGACIAETALPVIILNGKDSPNGKIFTLFHELTHIILRKDGISNFRFGQKNLYDKIEILCNQTAAETLVPTSSLRTTKEFALHTIGSDHWDMSEISKLVSKF